jgi:ADP-ribose pyrophosphatase
VRSTGERITMHVASVKGERPGAVCVVIMPNDTTGSHGATEDRYLLARHWRVSTRQWEWEFPRGMGEPGETPEQTAARELAEETAITVPKRSIEIVQSFHADTGVLRDSIAIAKITLDSADRPEDLRKPNGADWELEHPRWVTAAELTDAIANGAIVDGITLSAFAICQARG